MTPKGISLSELERIRREESTEFLSERVLARLQLAEAKSGDYDHQLAHRLAWHIVLHCMKGDAVECSPVTLAYYAVVGCHEEQYYDRVMIRRAAMFGRETNKLKFKSLGEVSTERGTCQPGCNSSVDASPERRPASGRVNPEINSTVAGGSLASCAESGTSPNLIPFPSPKLSPKSSPKKSDEEKSA